MKKKSGILILVVLVLLISLPVVSHAQEDQVDLQESVQVTAPMTLDCNSLRGKQIEARDLGMCLENGQGGITTQATVYGNCGSATLVIYDSFTDSGTAFFQTWLNSTRGNMVGGSLNVTWSGPSAGSFSPGTPFFKSSWYKSTSRVTGTGRVDATFSGWVGIANTTLACTVGPVSSFATIQ